ncbi:MAG TPA: hypothetical protein VMU04_23020, partial [Candidatus Acidoferrum sp.]|nr:hypothetical protein [Candidatus Acidoferrum sp.]
MLATEQLIQEAGQARRLEELLPRWLREVPLYRRRGLQAPDGSFASADLGRLPLITKQDIRQGFPDNF